MITDWFAAQHYPSLMSPNTTGVFKLGVFDNGGQKVVDDIGTECAQTVAAGPCYTRGVIYQVDEVAKTASVFWQYNAAPVFSAWGGSFEQLNNGNFAIDLNTPSDNPTGARYLEVTSDPSPQMEVSGQNAYRITHLPSLYPDTP